MFGDHLLIQVNKICRSKYCVTFLCGGVVLAVLNLYTKNLNQNALESGKIRKKCSQ